MDYSGLNWIEEGLNMLPFFGHEKISLDANGRVKLSPRFVDDFRRSCDGEMEVVLFCLSEGCLAVYPQETFLRMRRSEVKPEEKAAESLLFRRKLRLNGAMTHSDVISNQGRITVPHFFRDFIGLNANVDAVIVGVEIGIEIWTAKKWKAEFEKISAHVNEKGELEMASDLYNKNNGGKTNE